MVADGNEKVLNRRFEEETRRARLWGMRRLRTGGATVIMGA